MADTKLSAIATSGSNLVAADQIVGVNGGTTDLLFSGTQITALALTHNLGDFAATTSAQLRGVISDETGTGVLVFATTPTLVTPVLGVATGTSVALGGATIGSDALGITGNATITGNLSIVSGSLITSGNLSAAAWTTNGIRNKMAAASYTDTSSSGTVAAAYTDLFGAGTILASSATTYTNYYGSYFVAPVASTNVTMTNKWALGADTILVAGAGAASLGPLTMTGTPFAGTGTTSVPLLYLNNGSAPSTFGTAGTYIGVNAANASTANFLDFHINGGVSLFSVASTGGITIGGAGGLNCTGGGTIGTTGSVFLTNVSASVGYNLRNGNTIITSPATGSVQSGAIDNAAGASVVAQTLRVQSVAAGGTNNQNGQNWTVIGSLSTGSGTNGDIVFQTGLTGTNANSQNAATTSLTLKGGTQTVQIATAKALAFASGTNQRAGSATLVAGTVTVSNTTVTANTVVMLTRKTSGGTIGTAITYTVSAATSFTINSDNVLDTSTFSYMLLEVP